jgi:hypothetical protein
MNQKKPPTGVSVVAWIIIVGYSTLFMMTLFGSSLPAIQQRFERMGTPLPMVVAGSLIGLVSGIAMLCGLNWGRLLYFWYIPIAIVLRWLLYGFHPTHLSNLIFYLIVVEVLTMPAASAFFINDTLTE